nr:uncharacterized protein LOC132596711 [Globicephala melas]
MALAFRAASSRPGSVSLTSAAAAPHHGGGPLLRRLSRGLRRDVRPSSNSPDLANRGQAGAECLGERGGWAGRPECLLPRLSQPRRGSGFPNTHTSSQRAWGSGGAATTPRYPHAGPARRGGTAFPTRPPPALDVGAPAPTLGPRPSALVPPPRLHAPLAGPLRAPQGSGQPGCLWQPRERPQSKRRSKEKAKEEQRPGSCGLAWSRANRLMSSSSHPVTCSTQNFSGAHGFFQFSSLWTPPHPDWLHSNPGSNTSQLQPWQAM